MSGSGTEWKLHSKGFDEELEEGQVAVLRIMMFNIDIDNGDEDEELEEGQVAVLRIMMLLILMMTRKMRRWIMMMEVRCNLRVLTDDDD